MTQRFVVHKQKKDGTLEEVHRYFELNDALSVYETLESGLIVDQDNEVIRTKNLRLGQSA